MTMVSKLRWTVALTCVLLLVAAPASAQEETGNLYGRVTDTAGVPLPGVTVSLSGMGAERTQITDRTGHFRFLALDPGEHDLTASLDGFSSIEYPNIKIRVARNTTIEIQLSAAIEEVISVTAESPLLDERKLTAGTTVSQVELEKIPTARDPWAILSQTPGVLVGKINVGGNESGQQSQFRGPTAGSGANDFLVDGVQITDMAASGSSSTYYDFDQFEEIQMSTGGNDIIKNSSGVTVNLVTKRGTNEFRGSARFLLTDGEGYFGGLLKQADPGFSEADLGPGQTEFVGNRIDRIQDLGFEAGGPALPNRVWLWASWGQNDITNITGGGTPDRTVLENTAIKLNAQFSAANSFVGSFNNGDKRKFGRGANPSWHPSATWNQRGPSGIHKYEDTHVFGSSLFLSAQYSFIDGGFSMTAQGGAGRDQPATPEPGGEMNVTADGFQTNNSSGGNTRPTEELRLEGSYFFNSGNLNHELKFGGRTREAKTAESWSYPGRNIWHYNGVYAGVQDPALLASLGLPPERAGHAHAVYAYRQGPAPVFTNYESAWVQDTLTAGRWTFNFGLRDDHQDGRNAAATVDANPAFPELMPELVFDGNDGDGLEWTSIVPRLGLTYALGEERKTLIRGSFSQFPQQLWTNAIGRVNPVRRQGLALIFLDQPGGFDSFYDEGEPFAVLGGFWGFNVDDPSALSTANKTDPNLDPEITNELIVGVEHSFLPELVAGLSVTWRHKTDYDELQLLFRNLDTGEVTTIPATEYVPDRLVTGSLPDGSPYAVETWAADPSRWSYTGGKLFTNGDREIDYLGAALTLTKRLSNRWMMRAFFNYNFDESWDVPSSFFSNNDPNRQLPIWEIGSPTDGETFVQLSGNTWSSVVGMHSTWHWNLNGMYQMAPERPWGFNVAVNLNGREGYAIPYFRQVGGVDGISRRILVVDDIADFRLDDVYTADLRLEKEFAATGDLGLTFSIDGFNIFNAGYVLSTFNNLGAGNATWVESTLSPRVWRLGVRLSWR